jgi:hypothetical protein
MSINSSEWFKLKFVRTFSGYQLLENWLPPSGKLLEVFINRQKCFVALKQKWE